MERSKEEWRESAEEEGLRKSVGSDIYNYISKKKEQATPNLAEIHMDTSTLGNPDAMDGIYPDKPRYDRTGLLQKLFTMVETNLFTLLSSSAASRKTSLLCLFCEAVKLKWNVTFINCNEKKSLKELLLIGGIDSSNRSYRSPFANGLPHIIMLDDAQKKYDDPSWRTLIKGMLPKLSNCRIIISAVHSLKPEIESPVDFSSLQKLTRNDFLLSYSESLAFLSDEKIGLKGKLTPFSTLKEVIARECGGLIGALKLCVNELEFQLLKYGDFSENEALRVYFSNRITESMVRCFGSGHSRPVSQEVTDFLERFLIGDRTPLWIQKLEQNDALTSVNLLKSGILEEESNRISFSSRMAERYYFKYLFPYLSETLQKLVEDAITRLPFTVLQKSIHEGNFPKEAVFQHLFMNALVFCTPPSVAIHPELSQPFGSTEKIPGEIDFYIDGDLCWGIELLVKGAGISGHIDRFGPDGTYAKLNAEDYAVIDFRELIDGKPANVQRHANRYTAFFDPKDFSTCILYSETENVKQLSLSRQ